MYGFSTVGVYSCGRHPCLPSAFHCIIVITFVASDSYCTTVLSHFVDGSQVYMADLVEPHRVPDSPGLHRTTAGLISELRATPCNNAIQLPSSSQACFEAETPASAAAQFTCEFFLTFVQMAVLAPSCQPCRSTGDREPEKGFLNRSICCSTSPVPRIDELPSGVWKDIDVMPAVDHRAPCDPEKHANEKTASPEIEIIETPCLSHPHPRNKMPTSSSQPACKNLVLDAGPLLSFSPLRNLAQTYYIVPQVISELKDPRAKQHFESLALNAGVRIQVRDPTPSSLAHS